MRYFLAIFFILITVTAYAENTCPIVNLPCVKRSIDHYYYYYGTKEAEKDWCCKEGCIEVYRTGLAHLFTPKKYCIEISQGKYLWNIYLETTQSACSFIKEMFCAEWE